MAGEDQDHCDGDRVGGDGQGNKVCTDQCHLSIRELCAVIAELLCLVHMAGWTHCCTICNSQCTNCMLFDVLLISYYWCVIVDQLGRGQWHGCFHQRWRRMDFTFSEGKWARIAAVHSCNLLSVEDPFLPTSDVSRQAVCVWDENVSFHSSLW